MVLPSTLIEIKDRESLSGGAEEAMRSGDCEYIGAPIAEQISSQFLKLI
jgi:hypothetical protein